MGMRAEAGMLTHKRGAEMVEAAVTLPVVILVLMFVINGAMAGFTAMAAANAYQFRNGLCLTMPHAKPQTNVPVTTRTTVPGSMRFARTMLQLRVVP